MAVWAAAVGTGLAAEMFREAPASGAAARLGVAGHLAEVLLGPVAHEVRPAWEAEDSVAGVAAAGGAAGVAGNRKCLRESK